MEKEDTQDVELVGSNVGDPEEETRMREGSGGAARESGAGQRREGQGQTGHTVVCAAGTQRAGWKVQSATRQWYDVHADMFRRDNIPEGAGQGDHCWRCIKEVGQVPWPVLRMTAWAFPNATMRATEARGQWWGPVLRLPKKVQEGEEAQGEVEVWWGDEKEGKRTGSSWDGTQSGDCRKRTMEWQ